MTTEFPRSVGALAHESDEWHAIDWQKVSENVRRLQVRIVQATKEGRWGKVKALQHLLTHSFSGRAMAVRRVTENDGKKTAGVDGETWNTPRRKRPPYIRLSNTATSPNRSGVCISPKATARNARWVSRP
jgi:RNA-directed DNA polymerase